MSAPSDDEWPEVLTKDGEKLLLNDKLLVLEIRVEALIEDWQNAQLMHPGRDKMQRDLEWRFPGYYAIFSICTATILPSAGPGKAGTTPQRRARFMLRSTRHRWRSSAMDVFAMPEVTLEREKYDCILSAVDRHSRYIVAFPGKKSKKKDRKDKHGVGPQAETVAKAMVRHCLTIFDVPGVIFSDRVSQFVGSSLKRMCKHMGIRHAKTMAYHSR